MKRLYLKILATILTICGAMTFISCSDHDVTNDNGITSWIYDQYMDKNIKPGDDFYMFCNGGYWNQTTFKVGDDVIKGFQDDEYEPYEKRYQQGVTYPMKERLAQSILNTDDAARGATDALIQSALDRIDAVENSDQLWEVVGQLWQEGYNMDLDLSLFSRDGKMVVTMYYDDDDDEEDDEDEDDDEGDDEDEDVRVRLLQDPQLQAGMVPLAGQETRAAVVGVDDEWPMLITLFQTLGIDLDKAYIGRSDLDDSDIEQLVQVFQQMQVQANENLEEMISGLKESIEEDRIISTPDYIAGVKLFGSEGLNSRFQKLFAYEQSKMFAEKVVTPERKSRVENDLEKLREAFRNRLVNNAWMSDASKAVMIEKLDNMQFFVGKPDEWLDVEPDFTGSTCALDDLMRIRKARLETQKRLIGMDKDKASFHVMSGLLDEDITLAVLNAAYMNNFNSLYIFPAWILEPFYSDNNEDAVNYATLVVSAHEITHGFDAKGALFETDGDQREGGIWANPEDAQKFQDLTQRLVECYNKFEVMDELPGLHNDGAYTLNENIADLGGFEIAYEAFVNKMVKKGVIGEELTNQKRHFYQAYANLWRSKYTPSHAQEATNGEDKDKHSLCKERINGVVCNTDAWYDLFDVKEGQKLYLPQNKRAHIW